MILSLKERPSDRSLRFFIWYRLSASTLIIVAILEMFIGTDKELGHLNYNAHMTYQIPQRYATLIIIGLIGYGMNKGFIKSEEEVIHWGGDKKENLRLKVRELKVAKHKR